MGRGQIEAKAQTGLVRKQPSTDSNKPVEARSTMMRRGIMHRPKYFSLILVSLIFAIAVATPGSTRPDSSAAAFTTLLFEDFSSGLAGWTVIDGGTGDGPAPTWTGRWKVHRRETTQ